MVEDVDRSRNDKVSKAPWLKIFMGFKLALDPKKLLLAAAGIFIAYLGWWAISWVFYNVRPVPRADGIDGYTNLKTDAEKEVFLGSATSWSLLHVMAGSPVDPEIIKAWEKVEKEADKPNAKIEDLLKAMKHPYGLLRECPWNEDRGPNQFLVVSKIIQHDNQHLHLSGYFRFVIEPIYKFLLPVTYFFDSRAGGILSWNRLYLIAIMFWTIAVWGIFGGAITRMACVQIARNEKVGLRESLEFVMARWQGYVFAPVLPLGALFVLGIMLWVFGFFFGITFALGDIVGGLLWPFTMIMGLIMAVILVGLLGWPLMNATISTEGSDSFDALSRSYSYVYQVPWHCLGYSLLSIVYGAILVFFAGFMGTLVVYLSNWGIDQAHYFDSRDPAFLYAYAPESFEWRDVLLKDSPNAVEVGGHYQIKEKNLADLQWYQHSSIGTYLVTIWLGLFFLLIIGFSYSFFWTAATIIYLLLRQKVDDTDLDEVYLEEEDDKQFMPEGQPPAAPTPGPTAPPVSSAPPSVKFTMVDAPAPVSGPSVPPPAEPTPAPPPPPPLTPAPPTSTDPGTSSPPPGL